MSAGLRAPRICCYNGCPRTEEGYDERLYKAGKRKASKHADQGWFLFLD